MGAKNNNFISDSLKAYLNEINQYPILSVDEQKDLAKKYIAGDIEAKQKLINCNLRFVVSICRNLNIDVCSLDLLDLIQEGNLGLIRALETYNPDIAAFTSYAYDWVLHYVLRGIQNKGFKIRVSCNVQEKRKKYLNLINSYKNSCRDLPSDEEICKILNISSNILKKIKMSFNFDTVSLNSTIGDSTKEIGDFIVSNNLYFDDVENNYDNTLLLLILKDNLNPLQYFVLYYYIFNNWTLEKIAKQFNLSRERIRIIKDKALQKSKFILNNQHNYSKQIMEKYSYSLEGVNLNPIQPDDIIFFLYFKTCLTIDENKLYRNIYFGENNKIKNKEKLEKKLYNKCKLIDKNSDYYLNFKKNLIEQNGSSLYKGISEDYILLDFKLVKNYNENERIMKKML